MNDPGDENDVKTTRRIAVYGSLRKGEYNYRPAQGDPVATGLIHGARLYSLGTYPCIVASDDANDSVAVEVYDLPDNLFWPIERMELGAGYTRRTVTVNTDNGIVEADAYFYPQAPTYGEHVPSGDWSQR